MTEAILTKANIEGSEERLSVRYQVTAGGDPKIIDVKAGTVDVTHLIDHLQRARFKKEIIHELRKQPIDKHQERFLQQMSSVGR
jgi:hypothetical protein